MAALISRISKVNYSTSISKLFQLSGNWVDLDPSNIISVGQTDMPKWLDKEALDFSIANRNKNDFNELECSPWENSDRFGHGAILSSPSPIISDVSVSLANTIDTNFVENHLFKDSKICYVRSREQIVSSLFLFQMLIQFRLLLSLMLLIALSILVQM